MKEIKPTTQDIETGRKIQALEESAKRGDNPRLAVLSVAEAFLGVREIGTSNRGYWINKFHKEVGLEPGYPWCLMFIQYVYRIAATMVGVPDILPYNTASTQSLASWAEKKWLCLDSLTMLHPGDLLIWKDGNKSAGHVGMVTHITDRSENIEIQTIEGNTSSTKYRDGGLVAVKEYTYERGDLGDARTRGRWLRCVVSFDRLLDYTSRD